MATHYTDKDGSTSLESANVTVPSDRRFRQAWALNETWDLIVEDLDAAKSLFKEKIRSTRMPLLEALDVEYIRALEQGASGDAIVAKKQALRDSPAASNIDSASDISALKSAWDEDVLGPSPY